MKERPVLFSAPTIRAILEGRKTQTRRICNPQPPPQPEASCHPSHVAKHSAPYLDSYCGEKKTDSNPRGMSIYWHWWQVDDRPGLQVLRCPFGQPGDRLILKCSWAVDKQYNKIRPSRLPKHVNVWTLFDGEKPEWAGKTRRAMFAPKRLWGWFPKGEITNIRVQRIQDISEEDAIAEGVVCRCWENEYTTMDEPPTMAFAHLWDSINAKRGSWEQNPFVWAVSFKLLNAKESR